MLFDISRRPVRSWRRRRRHCQNRTGRTAARGRRHR